MKNKRTLYHFILDSSGSMSADRVNTVNLFNKQVATVRSLAITYPEQTFLTGLTIFNEQINHLLRETPVHKLIELSHDRYRPDGYTALYDAIGESVSGIKERFGTVIENGEMSVVVIILTDGHENASRRFDQRMIAAMIDELQATDGWTFTILGADFDITQVSDGMNLERKYTFNYSKSDFQGISDDMENSLRSYADSKSKGFIDKNYFKKG
ncbi:MAG: vWA domain-containing protein [Bacteroidota bacterium]|jgi:Mg-chelatase subunit ChlD